MAAAGSAGDPPPVPGIQFATMAPPAPRSPAWGSQTPNDLGPDTELLKAMAHEIRTPLTTIRTFTRSLLKRQDISEAVAKRLHLIDQECTQQIDRFNLIFRAVELETDRNRNRSSRSPLSAIALNQLFEDAIPLWQQRASRRNLSLEVEVPPQLPMVNSDPIMLNQVLTGLIDRFTHSLPPYSHIQLAVTLAGHQLKLQFQSQPPGNETRQPPPANPEARLTSPFKALGQLLMFQPETGGLSLNLNVTKNLFQALGGKLIVRQRPQTGEVLTVFLPLETRTL
jgi:signal transduction histidine kinase